MPTANQTATEIVMSVVDSTIVPKSVVEGMVSTMPTIGTLISTEAFYNTCKEIHDNTFLQRNLLGSSQDFMRRGMTHGAISRLYSDNIVQLEAPDKSYAEWFAERNIDISTFGAAELDTIFQELIQETTGLSLNTSTSLKDVQTAMLKMLSQLSSYSIQLVGDIKGDGITRLDTPVVRVGNLRGSSKDHEYYPINPADVLVVRGRSGTHLKLNLSAGNATDFKGRSSQNHQFDPSVEVRKAKVSSQTRMRVELVNVKAKAHIPLAPVDRRVPAFGTAEYMALTIAERGDTVSEYTGDYSTGQGVGYMKDHYVEKGYVSYKTNENGLGTILPPVFISPLNGSTSNALTLSLITGEMQTSEGYMSNHVASTWEIYEASAGWAGPVSEPGEGILLYSVVDDAINLGFLNVPPQYLSAIEGATRVTYSRVKYKDQNGIESPWSILLVVNLQHP
jgi:hypothetical protein